MKTRFFLICIFLCAIFTTKAQEYAELQKANGLAAAGAYFEAGIAYERVLFASPPPDTAFKAISGKLECLKKQGFYAEAEQYIHAAYYPDFTAEQRGHLFLQQVLCAYLSGQFENTVSLIDRMPFFLQGVEEIPASVKILKILSLNELQRWEEAEKVYLEWAVSRGMDTSAERNPYTNLPRFKKESKAEWLSTFIPGAGQIYAGKPWEGVASILIQGAGIYFGVVSFLDKYYLSAWAGAGLFGSFHLGGVRRSAVLVKQYNRKKMGEFNGKVRHGLNFGF